MTLLTSAPVRRIAALLPKPVKARLRRLALMGGHPYAPAVKTTGTIQDLYFWIADGQIDTVVPLENYFSVFFPDRDTATTARLVLFDANGEELGETTVPVGHMATPLVRISELLAKIRPGLAETPAAYGNLIWYMDIPAGVIDAIDAAGAPFLFWDRLYIGYVASDDGAASFVHGVDKYDILTTERKRIPWPAPRRAAFTSVPEAPIHMAEYERLEVIIQNRVSRPCAFTLTVSDHAGKTVAWDASVAPRGVHRFAFDAEDVAALDTASALMLRLDGLPTRYGRPLLFKLFRGGVFSAMHC